MDITLYNVYDGNPEVYPAIVRAVMTSKMAAVADEDLLVSTIREYAKEIVRYINESDSANDTFFTYFFPTFSVLIDVHVKKLSDDYCREIAKFTNHSELWTCQIHQYVRDHVEMTRALIIDE